MPIIRAPTHRDNYIIMDKQGIEDERLSFRARGLLIYLLTKPAGWEVSLRQLARHTPVEGREALMKVMQELETYGYASKTLQRDDKTGKLRGYLTIVYERPDLAHTEVGKSDFGKNAILPCNDAISRQNTEVGKSDFGTEVGKTEVGKTATSKNINPNKDLKARNTRQENSLVDQPGKPGKSTTERSASSSRLKRKQEYSALFWTFYEVYPRHEDPDDAWKAWQSLDGDALAPTIMAGVDANKRSNDAWKRGDRKYIKLPAAFLRKGGYKSDFAAQASHGEHDPVLFRQLLDAEGIPYEC